MPCEFGSACEVIDVAGECEEVVAEAVDIGEDYRSYKRSCVGEVEDFALGTAADGACDMGVGCPDRSAGEDEQTKRWDRRVEKVDLMFKLGEDRGERGCDFFGRAVGLRLRLGGLAGSVAGRRFGLTVGLWRWCGEICADVEQSVVD